MAGAKKTSAQRKAAPRKAAAQKRSKTSGGKPATTVDEYIAAFPADVGVRLRKLRSTIRKAAPQAEEGISYRIPAYKLHGSLIFFAAFAQHIGVYPAPRGSDEFRDELAAYAGGKGTVQFPHDEPLPLDLIRRIVKFRVAENLARKKR